MTAPTRPLMSLTDALSKTESFDADLRFMGLSDLQELLLQDEKQVNANPQVRKAVVDLLGDSITEVQNQAIKTLGPLVSAGSEASIAAIIADIAEEESLTRAVKALAYRTIMAQTPPKAAALTARLMLEKLSTIETVDDLDVVIDLLRTLAGSLNSMQTATLLKPIMDLLRSGSETLGSGLQRLRAFEALKLGIPLVSDVDSVWTSIIEFFADLASQRFGPELRTGALQLASWLPASDLEQSRLASLWATIGGKVNELLSRTPTEDENVDECEAALMVVTAFSSKGFFEDPRWIVEVAARFVEWDALYTRNDQLSDAQISDGIDDDLYDDDEDDAFSDVDDNSFRVRRWAANLLGTLSAYAQAAADAVSVALRALANERDESVRNSLYSCLSELPNVDADAVIPAIERDPYNAAGLELILKLGPNGDRGRVMKIAKVASSRRSLLRLALELVKMYGESHDESASAIVLKGLSSSDYAIQVLSLETARAVKNCVFTVEALKFARTAADNSLRSLALTTAAELCTVDLADEVLDVLVRLILREPPSRAIAAAALDILLGRDVLSTASVLRAVQTLCEALEMQPPVAVAALCYQCLITAGAQLGPSQTVVRAVISGPVDIDRQAEALRSQVADPLVQEWLVNQPALSDTKEGGLLNLAAECSKLNPELVAVLQERGASAEVVAAGIIAAKLETFPVGTNLPLVGALASQGYPTLTVADIATISTIEPIDMGVVVHALGKVAALNESQLELLMNPLTEIPEEVRIKALSIALEARPDYGEAVWERIRNEPRNQNPALSCVLARLIISDGSAAKLREFSTQITVATIQLALPEVTTTSLANELLELLIVALGSDDPSRVQAPTTIAWALQTIARSPLTLESVKPQLPRIIHGLSQSANARDPSMIRTVQIGPFKHKVDDLMPLRQTSFEAFYGLIPYIEDQLTPEVAESIVAGLTDTENDVKILACQVIPLLYKANPKLLDHLLPQIEAAFETEMDKKLKDTVGKQEHDKHASLIRAVQDAKLALFG